LDPLYFRKLSFRYRARIIPLLFIVCAICCACSPKIYPPERTLDIPDRPGKYGWNSLNSVVYCPDGKSVLLGIGNGVVELRNLESGAIIREFEGHYSDVECAAISPDGKYAVSGSENELDGDRDELKVWNIETGDKVISFAGQTGGVEAVAFYPGGRFVASGGVERDGKGTIKLWDIETGKLIRTITIQDDDLGVTSIAFTSDGKYLLSGTGNGPARLWETASGDYVRSFSGHFQLINSVAISPDDKYVLTGAMDNTMKLWDLNTGEEIRTFRGHAGVYLGGVGVTCVAFTPNGRYVLSGAEDNKVKLWDIQSGKCLRTFGPQNGVYSLAVSSDGTHVLVGNYGGLALFDLGLDEKN